MQNLMPQWKTHIFWQEKLQFQLAEDTYEDWVMFVVEQGSFRYRINDEDNIARFGDVVICPPYTRFHRETITPLTFHFVVFSLSNDDGKSEFSTMPVGKVSILEHSDRLAYNNTQLRQQEPFASSQLAAYREHVLTDIWYMALREWHRHLHEDVARVIPPIMQQAAVLLKERALSGTNLKEIAQQLGMTSVQLTRQFQAAFHVTPIHFTISIRMHRASKLLAETDLTLDQIAQECGYENGFYLSRMFQKHMNLRPSQYRKTHRL